MARPKTKTSSFGSSKREGHDASQFYSSNLYLGFDICDNQEIIDHSNKLTPEFFDKTHPFSIEMLKKLPDHSIHLLIFDLTNNLNSKFFETEINRKFCNSIEEIKRILITGGKVVLIVNNAQNNGESNHFFPFHAFLIQDMITAKFLMRGEVLWKNLEHTQTQNHLNSSYFHILVFSKHIFNRIKGQKTDTISRDQFLQYTKSIWKYQPELMTQVPSILEKNQTMIDCYNHLFQLYSFEDDNICCLSPKKLQSTIDLLKQSRKKIISVLIENDF